MSAKTKGAYDQLVPRSVGAHANIRTKPEVYVLVHGEDSWK